MTTAQLTDRRAARAQQIVQAGDIHETKPGVFRVRDANGSGTWHYVSKTTCDCEDFQRSGHGLDCKHVLAVKQAANWSTRQAQANELPGDFLDGDFSAFDDVVLTLPTQPAGPVCPACHGATKEDLLWCGKAMWQRFRVCQANREHRAVRI